ncbi:MAG TPA: AAA family ATPase [Pseudomonadales bacterium]|nr:AAA family ATPase [Pseudomonadales bacterium]
MDIGTVYLMSMLILWTGPAASRPPKHIKRCSQRKTPVSRRRQKASTLTPPRAILFRMYNEYFGLKDSPFSIAPNPQFLYMSERHREALAHLLYGIKSDGGFILLTGEVGTGKTTICRCLLAQVPEDVDTAFVLNPKLTAIELLATICDDLAISYPEGASIKTLVDRLNDFLLESYSNGRRTVLIIDEAQNLSIDVLEQLRLLTNLETNQRKLLQIILLGQPELLDILDRKELRQLAQRVTARFHLDALSRDEVTAYIRHRFEIAGGHELPFRANAIAHIYRLSAGIPRLINLICDRSLLGAYASDQRRVTRQIVDRAAAEIFGRRSQAARTPRGFLAVAAAAIIALVVGGYMLQSGEWPGHLAFTHQVAKTPTKAADTTSRQTAVPQQKDKAPPKATVVSRDEPKKPIMAANVTPIAAPETDALINVEGDDSAEKAMAELFTLWSAPFSAEVPACEQATRLGLACMREIGSLRNIQQLDRPAVIKLNIAGIDNYLAVTRIANGVVEVSSDKGNYRLKEADITRTWDGQYAMLWKPPPDYRIVKPGDHGPTVDWLVRQLAAINGTGSDPVVGAKFDSSVEQQLKRFQITQGIKPDGIAGINTWIHINSIVDSNVPHLSAPGG